MDAQILSGLRSTNHAAQAQVMQYFEQLKNSEDGWQLCANALLSDQYVGDEQTKFFCYQIIEHFIHNRYACSTDEVLKQNIRNFLLNNLQQMAHQSTEKSFLKNKLAQVVSLVFVIDYPSSWTSFFNDLLQLASLGPSATDLYLRILKAVDAEVVDREVIHSIQSQARNTLIKDTMRGHCVAQLVDSWYELVIQYENSQPELVCECLDVIGLYIAWIEIDLVANDRMVAALIRFLKMPLLRESACDCVTEIVHKGMEPAAKIKLIESFAAVLQSAGVIFPEEDEEGDFVVKLAKLVNSMGENLVAAWSKSVKGARGREASDALSAVEGKISLLFRFLSDEDDDVSTTVCPFATHYIGILKQLKPLSDKQKENVQKLILIILKKLEFSSDYDFTEEGEEEAMFQEYRKSLKILFSAIAKLDSELILATVHNILGTTLEKWRENDFRQVEVALLLVYWLGEALPASQNQHFKGDVHKASALQQMMRMIVTSGVSCHPHHSVTLQYFETIVRYEKFFLIEPDNIGSVLASFLDERGLRHKSTQVRSRVSYLFTRFVKSIRSHIAQYTSTILEQLEGLLELHTPLASTFQLWLTSDEQMFLYEIASQLIVGSDFPIEKKALLIRNMLQPVLQKFQVVYEELCREIDEGRQLAFAECLVCAMSFASRASKGFNNQATMKACSCVEVFTSCLEVFISTSSAPVQRQLLQQGVRQFFHRMVVCLEEDVLPFVPTTVNLLLENPDVKELHDFLPMMNQLVTKFKKTLEPFLQEAFMPLVGCIFTVLSSVTDERDTVTLTDMKMLRRGYFAFMANLVSCDLADVIRNQNVRNLEEVLMTFIHGASDIPDPTAQKSCFSVLKQLVDKWGGKDGLTGFDDFILEHIVPVCLMTPTKSTFDWSDAQTVLLLGDIAACLKVIHTKQGQGMITWLQTQYFPSLQLPQTVSQEFCIAVANDQKKFKEYLKTFYENARNATR